MAEVPQEASFQRQGRSTGGAENAVTRRGASRSRRGGRGRGRGRKRGRIGTRGEFDPSAGWRIVDKKDEGIVLEEDFMKDVIAERARLFCSSAADRLEVERSVRSLPSSRVGHVVLFMDEILSTCQTWLNEYIVLNSCEGECLGLDDMYRFVAVLLMSHCTGFSFARTIRLLNECGSKAPSLDSARFISTHILAFSPTGRGGEGGSSWSAQRDKTPLLTQFEQTAFRATRKAFVTPNHLLATLDDDLYGTRASDNQVKTLGNRKADKEGHTVDAIADALFRITLAIRFRRRGETQASNVKRLVESLLEGRGEQSVHGLVVTGDRGYGKISLIRELMKHGIGSIMVMPEHLTQCHPFVGRSFYCYTRQDEEEGDMIGTNEDEIPQEEREADDELHQEVEEGAFKLDRPRAFVVDDSPSAGNASWFATKSLKPDTREVVSNSANTNFKAVAVAVREGGTAKFSRILRFIYNVPTGISQMIETWIAVPQSAPSFHKLFSKRKDDGGILEPPIISPDQKDEIERRILAKCVVLTVGQRCADWFVLRQFRITGTTAGKILCDDEDVRQLMGYPSRCSGTAEERSSPQNLLRSLTRAWFSNSRSTEPMMRGTANEAALFPALSRRPFVKALYECGMLGMRGSDWLACSPDGVALIDASLLTFSEESLPSSGSLSLSSVEIKTSIARSSLDRALQRATMEIVCCNVGDATFREYVPEEHVGQILHQMVVLSVNYVVYVSASEGGIMYIVVVHAPRETLNVCEIALRSRASAVVAWAHEEDPIPPEFVDLATKRILKERIGFWQLVNNYVTKKGSFLPLKLFKHGSQSLYSKTKGGVDGSAQARAILRSSTSSLKWEQKIVSQTIKTLAVNSFIAWRISEKKGMLESKEAFHSLDYFRDSLNALESLADFVCNVSSELLTYADKLRRAEEAEVPDGDLPEVSPAEVIRLRALALGRKKKRLWFFNGPDGSKLRVSVRGHEVRQQREHRYCALCGGNGSDTGWRGHRSTFKCSHCDVHLCIRTYPGLRKSCWDVWHTARKLTPRSTPRPSRSSDILPEQQSSVLCALRSPTRRSTRTAPRRSEHGAHRQEAPTAPQVSGNNSQTLPELSADGSRMPKGPIKRNPTTQKGSQTRKRKRSQEKNDTASKRTLRKKVPAV